MEWDSIFLYFRNLSAFLFVILLAFLTLRYGLGYFHNRFNRGVLKVVERVVLDPRRGNALYLVQVGDEYYLLGASQGSLRLIKELQAETVEQIREEQSDGDGLPDKASFQEILGFFKKEKG